MPADQIDRNGTTSETFVRGEALRVEVEDLARELVRRINAEAVDGRERLRELAVGVLRDEVEIEERDMAGEVLAIAVPPAAATANPFAIGIPLFLVGAVMVILFPPVGLMLFAAAAAMIVWGIAAVMLRPAAKR